MAKRYSCPFSLLDGFISSLQFTSFIEESWKLFQEDFIYEFWLHKINDGSSFNTFRKKLDDKPVLVKKELNNDEVKKVIEDSKNILTQFRFEESR